ncbi:MAG: SDR family NAD(P)-dependent oxidoreductase [Pseudomonadota bacterium]
MSKVALITGASSGFGQAIAQRLAQSGYKLILLARRLDRLEALAKAVAPYTVCHVITADLRNHGALKQALSTLPAHFQNIDVLVNNAGLALGLETAQKADWQDWAQMIDTNCTALAYITHLVLPGMVERNGGHIVNIGSTAGRYAYKGANVYGASKAFVEQFSQNLKSDLIGTAVRITHIAPGLAGGSEFSLVRFKGDEEKAKEVYAGTVPLEPDTIADAVNWAINQPPHVNVTHIELMPVCQALAGYTVHRN